MESESRKNLPGKDEDGSPESSQRSSGKARNLEPNSSNGNTMKII